VKRDVTSAIKRAFKRRRRRARLIGHLKEHHRMGRNQLAHRAGDASSAVLAVVGPNFRRGLAWFALLLFFCAS